MNHFFTVWTKPNETIRDLIDNRSLGYGILILVISALGSSVLSFSDTGVIDHFSLVLILLISIGLTIIVGIPLYFFNALVYWLLGKMLGGTGRYTQVFMATAGGALPLLAVLPVSIIAIALYGPTLFMEPADPFAMTNMSGALYAVYILVTLASSIYGVVVLSKALGYAHSFSALRGFGTVLIYMALAFILVVIVFVIFLVIGIALFNTM